MKRVRRLAVVVAAVVVVVAAVAAVVAAAAVRAGNRFLSYANAGPQRVSEGRLLFGDVCFSSLAAGAERIVAIRRDSDLK